MCHKSATTLLTQCIFADRKRKCRWRVFTPATASIEMQASTLSFEKPQLTVGWAGKLMAIDPGGGGFSIGSHAAAAGSGWRGRIQGEGPRARTEIGAAAAALRRGEIGIWRRRGGDWRRRFRIEYRWGGRLADAAIAARVSLRWAPPVCLSALSNSVCDCQPNSSANKEVSACDELSSRIMVH